MKKKLVPVLVLCDDGWKCKACPEIYLHPEDEPMKHVHITDDFGHEISMSSAQFQVLVAKAKAGVLDAI